MTIDFWACLIISQIYFATVNKDNKVMLAFTSIAWFALAAALLFSTPVTK